MTTASRTGHGFLALFIAFSNAASFAHVAGTRVGIYNDGNCDRANSLLGPDLHVNSLPMATIGLSTGWGTSFKSDADARVQQAKKCNLDYPFLAVAMAEGGGGSNAVKEFKDIINGVHDDEYKYMFEAFANAGYQEIGIRIAWEYNCCSWDWSSSDPSYAQAFAHIAALGHAQTVQTGMKVNVMWAPNNLNNDPRPTYPGDDAVDIVGVDEYDSDGGGIGSASTDAFSMSSWSIQMAAQWAADHHKLFGIGESGACKGFWADWAGKILQAIQAGGNPPVDMIHFYDDSGFRCSNGTIQWEDNSDDVAAIKNLISHLNGPGSAGGGGIPTPGSSCYMRILKLCLVRR
jgi:hypothetical protein